MTCKDPITTQNPDANGGRAQKYQRWAEKLNPPLSLIIDWLDGGGLESAEGGEAVSVKRLISKFEFKSSGSFKVKAGIVLVRHSNAAVHLD